MLLKLFLAFTLIPVAEIYLLIKIGGYIGAFNTIIIVWKKIQEELADGVMPAEELLDALLIFAAGIVLLTPGLITDAAGLLLLIPETRYQFKRYLKSKFNRWFEQQKYRIDRFP